MSGSDFDLTGSRLQNATRVSQANEDADVVDWVKDDAFILCAMVEALGHSGASGTLQLRWRNVTDSGSFIVLSLSGELTFGLTDLVNGNAVVSGEEVCTPVSGSTLVDGVEREFANDVSTTLAQNEYAENQWGVGTSGVLGGKQYEFEIYDATAGAAVGTCLAQITTAVSGDVEILANTDALALAENPATVNAETNVLAGTDALTLAENPAVVNAETSIQAVVDALTIAEFAAIINAENNIQANLDALVLSENPAIITTGGDVNVLAIADVLILAELRASITKPAAGGGTYEPMYRPRRRA